ncbi:MAG TPA: protoporphyrinogen oxidase [Pseudonocardiaceae bacterium]|jgi:oxygen-dependent protoporphyrinogen oxidase|nr:protoporphyrinogen oxidase [Pseudonocardiaceae bacterium]
MTAGPVGGRIGSRIAVVGGGISGLAAAYRLRRLLGPDAEITVVEQARRLGGKLHAVDLAGRRYDVGAEAFLVRRPEVDALVRELGLESWLTHPAAVSAAIRVGGASRPIPPRTMLGVPASAADVADVLSVDGTRRVAAESELPPVDLAGADIAVGALLRQRLGPEVPDRLVDPLLGGVYAGSADSLGLRATMPQLAAKLDAGAGSVLAASASLLPSATLGAPRPPVFGTLEGGLAGLADRLAEASGARLRLGLPVRALLRRPDGWRLDIGAATDPDTLDVDAVLLAVPAPAARKLLADVAPAASAAFARVELASMAVVALALPADVSLPPSSGVLIGSGERHADGTPFTAKAFTYSSRKWEHLGGPGAVLVRGSVGRYGDAEILRRDDADLVRAVRADFAELTGVSAVPEDVVVTRWGGGLPQYGVGHVDVVAGIERAVAEVPGLAVAGATLHGVGLPACVATADAAAARIAEHVRVRQPQP